MLASLIALAGIGSAGTVGFLNKGTETSSEIPEVKQETTVPPVETPSLEPSEIKKEPIEVKVEKKQESSTESDSKPNPSKVEDLNTKEEVTPEAQPKLQTTVIGGRIYDEETLKELAKREEEDERFGYIKTTLTWNGTSQLSEQQKKEAGNKFRNSALFKKLGEERELIGYEDYQSWRVKTSIYMRNDAYGPKELHRDVDNETIDTDKLEGREQYAWRLREICYRAADYIDNEQKIKEEFTVHESLHNEFSVFNLCTFPKLDK